MFRAPDAWDVVKSDAAPLTCGFNDGLLDKYKFTGRKLGKGGFGSVAVVQTLTTGHEYACKSIQKLLDIPNISPAKQQQHLTNIKVEITVLRKLRGTLNVVHLEDVYEDTTHVHIVMELCRGGELLQKVATRHYSERTVASYMRAVLRTLAQCHHHRILHRDIKPGNFMLLTESDTSPIKAIDFGLAVFFDPKALPRRDLGLEGTPHYMAPEVLSSEVYPGSDVWAAGVMAYQLLSGRFPFDDWKNPRNPALSQLWKSILAEAPKFSGSAWAEVSDGAKDFISTLLTRDVTKRPTAQQALAHPWIQGKSKQRGEGKPLAATIVQRLQRFSTANAFKRTVLDMIANELLMQHMHQGQQQAALQAVSAHGTAPDDTAPTAVLAPRPGRAVSADGTPRAQADGDGAAPQSTDPARAATGQLLPKRPLKRDPSDPHLRSMAAVSMLCAQRDKSATVHAGASVSRLLSTGLPAQRLAAQASQGGRGGSLDITPGLSRAASAAAPGAQQPGGAGASGPGGEAITATSPATASAGLPQQPAIGPDTPRSSAPGTARAQTPPLAPPGIGVLSLPGHPTTAPTTAQQPGLPALGRFALPTAAAPTRKELMEGSGHALQHYAFLLAAGERSLHGLSQRHAMARSVSTASLAGIPSGGGAQDVAAVAAAMSIAGQPTYPPAPHDMAQHSLPMPIHRSLQAPITLGSSPGGGLGNTFGRGAKRSSAGMPPMPPSLPKGSGGGGEDGGYWSQASGGNLLGMSAQGLDDMQRLLDAVNRQRQEHRKLQRLALDTTVHRPSDGESDAGGSGGSGTPENTATDLPGVKSAAGDGNGKKRGLLHRVGSALLKPVKGLVGAGGGSDGRTGSGSQSGSVESTHAGPDMSATTPPPPTALPALALAPPPALAPSPLPHPNSGRLLPNLGRMSALADALAAADETAGGVGSASAQRGAFEAIQDGSVDADGIKNASSLEQRGRGKGAYAALFGTSGTARDGADDAGVGQLTRQSATEPAGDGQDTALPAPTAGMPVIRTVKAHHTAPAVTPADSAGSAPVTPPGPPSPGPRDIATQLARLEARNGGGEPASGGGIAVLDGSARAGSGVGGTVSRGELYDVLRNLLGGPTQLAEFQAVLTSLHYDTKQELSFEEVSRGLKHMGYKLEPSEVETLLSEVAMGSEHISQAAFLASQVDWRQFQANHRDEWLRLLRKTFDGLARDTDGRIGEDQIVALLSNKLPAEQVNLAVQETLLDAAVLGAEGLDFDDFSRLLRADSDVDLLSLGSPALSSVHGPLSAAVSAGGGPGGSARSGGGGMPRSPSIDLYDARLDASLHGHLPPAVAVRAPGSSGGGAGAAAGAAALPRSPFTAGGAGAPPGLGSLGSGTRASPSGLLPVSWLAGQLGEAGMAHGGYQPGLETVPDQDMDGEGDA